MSVTYTRASRLPCERSGRGGASVVLAPVIDRSTTDTSLLLRCDQSVTVSVGVSGLPVPEVTWFVGSQRIVDSPEFRVYMDSGGKKHTLSVAKVTEDLEKGVKVQAVNCAGQDQLMIDVKTYKFLTGRSSSDEIKTSTLPVRQSERGGESEKAKTLHYYKSYNRFEMTQEDYENWQKEMESRSHMRSIDDILDDLSDDGSVESPSVDNKANPENNEVAKMTPPPSPTTCSLPSRPGGPAADFQKLPSSEVSDRKVGTITTRNRDLVTEDQESRVPVHAADRWTKSLLNGIPLWEMFGVKLSEFCRSILATDQGSVARQGSVRSVTRDHPTAGGVPRFSKDLTRSLPAERKFLGTHPQETQLKPSIRPDSARDAISIQGGRGEWNASSNLDNGNSAPASARCPYIRPPLAPKPSFTESRRPSGTGATGNRVPAVPNSLGPSVKRDTQVVPGWTPSQASHRVLQNVDPRAMNVNGNDSPLRGPLPPDRPTSLNCVRVHGSGVEENQFHSAPFPGDSSLHLDPDSVTDRLPVKADSMRKHSEIKPSVTRLRGEVLETHFGSPSESLTPGSHPHPKSGLEVPQSVPCSSADRTEANYLAGVTSPIQTNLVKTKPPIAKDKPLWNPGTGVKARAAMRPSSAATGREESGLVPNVLPQKPTVAVRRARSQSSGRMEESLEETSTSPGVISESTSVKQLSSSPAFGVESSGGPFNQPVGVGVGGRLQALAAKSEGLLTTRKRSVSPSVAGVVNQNGERGWRTAMPVSRSVDVLDTRNVEAMPRIGRRSLSKEWNVVTVTTKEEIVTILHRPTVTTTGTTTGKTTGTTTGTTETMETNLAWKLPLGSSRPYAV